MACIPETCPRHLFFTGKGGVRKTSLACASAILLGDAGQRGVDCEHRSGVEFGCRARYKPRQPTDQGVSVPDVDALNIGPEQAALDYRERTLSNKRILVDRAPMAIFQPA